MKRTIMARIVNEEDYAAKRNQIIDVAQRLIYTKGYEQMTIQDVLDGLQMSKGAFYHYFGSKESLLAAMLDRMLDEVERLVAGIVSDPDLPALEKLRRYFNNIAIWKTERKAILFPIMRVWYSDENTIVRQRLINMAVARLGPLFSRIVQQGRREGVMTTRFPDDIAGMIYPVFETIGESLVNLLLAPEPMPDRLERLEHTLAFYSDTLERLLGAPPGSLPVADMELITQWVDAPSAEPAPAELAAMA
jgi:TetR/AcrR family transcriptional repressor of nem operon